MSVQQPVRKSRPSGAARLKSQLVGLSKRGLDAVRIARRSASREYRRDMAQRAKVEDLFRQMAQDSTERFAGRVLVDALFDNPNFWFRLTLLRTAMGLGHAAEVGVTGQFNAGRCARSLKRIGVKKVVSLFDYQPEAKEIRAQARALLADTRAPEDILRWELPFAFPADQAYDALLKWQRKAAVDLDDPRLEGYLTECLRRLHAADRLLSQGNFDLVLISEPIKFDQGGLAWLATRRGIRTMIVTGHGGLTRLRQYFDARHVFDGGDRPSRAELDALSRDARERLAAIGREYLERRISGQTNELGAIYAYQRRTNTIDRAELVRRLGWDIRKPIMMVYAANWFDYPHGFGMRNFRDFLDWMQLTLDAASRATHVNWLFKAHPCDEWYGGVTLTDLLPARLPPHIGLAPADVNSRDLMLSVDAMVTVHGTSALEFVHAGKPVLAADRGWYHDIGFCKWAQTRDEYVQLLTGPWWEGFDLAEARRLAYTFAGMLFCCPAWQDGLVCGDDTEKNALYWKLPAMIESHAAALTAEVGAVRDWVAEGSQGFHTSKMAQAEAFVLANAIPVARDEAVDEI